MDYDFSVNFELIAERTVVNESTSPHKDIYVRIGKPVSVPSVAWACPYKIVGLGDESIRAVFGVDAVQSLQLVMVVVGSILEREQKALRLTHLGNEDLGFPKIPARHE